MMKQPRQQDPKHLAFLRMLFCCVCGDNTSTEAAHLRMANLRAGKRAVGLQEKPDDAWALPLCGNCHRDQHDQGEIEFWKHKADPHFLCLALYRVSGNVELGEMIVKNNMPADLPAFGT